MSRTEQKPVRVAVGVIQRNNRVLCCQRVRGSRYELKWEFPGGKVADGESPEDCLRRELFEELHITVQSMHPYADRIQSYPDNGVFHVHYFLIDNFSGNLKNKVFESIRWLSPDEFDDYPFLEGNGPVLRRLQREFST
jgi:mutator protein MutT